MDRTALFPGSFDPFTLGHQAIVEQGLRLFDRIVIGTGINTEKHGMLTLENRRKLIRDIYGNDGRIEETVYDGLTGEYCRSRGIRFILRGMRNTVDYEYERNVMLINQKLFPEITTVLMFTPPEYVAISSSMIREILTFGGDPTGLMPKGIDIKKYM